MGRYRQRATAAIAALAVVALILTVLALHRGSNLKKSVASSPPSFPPAVSASSVPRPSASASPTPSLSPSAHPKSSPPTHPVVAFLGDQYIAGDGATSRTMRWTTLVAADFGWTEKDFAFGATGYSTGGKLPGGTPYKSRVAAVAAAEPSIVIVAGGRYDIESANGPTQIRD